MQEKKIYQHATIWGIIGGTALAYIYIKTLGKGKGLDLTKTLLIGGAVGLGIGAAIDLSIASKPVFYTEEELTEKANTLGYNTQEEVKSYLSLMKTAKLSDEDNQKIMRVIDAQLMAKKDGKWDSNADMVTKKSILMTYGISEGDFLTFQNLVVTGFTNIIINAFNQGDKA